MCSSELLKVLIIQVNSEPDIGPTQEIEEFDAG
jgi:hypothetical protein